MDGELLGDMEGDVTLIVFEEDFFPESETAELGAFGDSEGRTGQQAVHIGAEPGLYATTIVEIGRTTISVNGSVYDAVRVSPDKTAAGDSGSPLFIDGVVVGVNNSGDGRYGIVTNPDLIYSLITSISEQLR